MDFGAHLPLIAFQGESWSLKRLTDYTQAARDLGFAAVSANDHFVFPRPWLDGPTALAAILDHTGDMALATTVSIPVVRGPIASAKTLAAIDLLSDGRLIVGVGPGSSPLDYAAVGIDFEERWKRLDEAIHTLRARWSNSESPFVGSFYSTDGVRLEPSPAQRPTPPIWIGSWGSAAGMRRVARLGDGWLASAYNTTPEKFAAGKTKLSEHLKKAGKDPETFPNSLCTMFMYLSYDRAVTDRVMQELLAPMIRRPEEDLRRQLLVGPPEECAAKLAAYQQVGLQRVYIWPVADAKQQLEMLQERVAPHVTGTP